MASRADVARNIDHTLHMLEADVRDLHSVIDEWESETIANRIGWDLEWAASTDTLDALCELERAGRLSQRQTERLDALIQIVSRLAPSLRQMHLSIPVCAGTVD